MLFLNKSNKKRLFILGVSTLFLAPAAFHQTKAISEKQATELREQLVSIHTKTPLSLEGWQGADANVQKFLGALKEWSEGNAPEATRSGTLQSSFEEGLERARSLHKEALASVRHVSGLVEGDLALEEKSSEAKGLLRMPTFGSTPSVKAWRVGGKAHKNLIADLTSRISAKASQIQTLESNKAAEVQALEAKKAKAEDEAKSMRSIDAKRFSEDAHTSTMAAIETEMSDLKARFDADIQREKEVKQTLESHKTFWEGHYKDATTATSSWLSPLGLGLDPYYWKAIAQSNVPAAEAGHKIPKNLEGLVVPDDAMSGLLASWQIFDPSQKSFLDWQFFDLERKELKEERIKKLLTDEQMTVFGNIQTGMTEISGILRRYLPGLSLSLEHLNPSAAIVAVAEGEAPSVTAEADSAPKAEEIEDADFASLVALADLSGEPQMSVLDHFSQTATPPIGLKYVLKDLLSKDQAQGLKKAAVQADQGKVASEGSPSFQDRLDAAVAAWEAQHGHLISQERGAFKQIFMSLSAEEAALQRTKAEELSSPVVTAVVTAPLTEVVVVGSAEVNSGAVATRVVLPETLSLVGSAVISTQPQPQGILPQALGRSPLGMPAALLATKDSGTASTATPSQKKNGGSNEGRKRGNRDKRPSFAATLTATTTKEKRA